jgi:hypothetical protein
VCEMEERIAAAWLRWSPYIPFPLFSPPNKTRLINARWVAVRKRALHHCRVQGALQPSIEAHRTALGQDAAKRRRIKSAGSIRSLDASALLLVCGMVPRADSSCCCADLRARDDDGGSAGPGTRTVKRPQRAAGVGRGKWGASLSITRGAGAPRDVHQQENAICAASSLSRAAPLWLQLQLQLQLLKSVASTSTHKPWIWMHATAPCLESTQGGIRAGCFSCGHGY